MSALTLLDLRTFLRNLLTDPTRSAMLDETPIGRGYRGVLSPVLAEIEALPPATTGVLVNKLEMQTTDARGDGHFLALFHLAHATLANPDATAEEKDAANFVHGSIIGARSAVRLSYALEQARASDLRPVIAANAERLKRLKLGADVTGFDLASRGCDAWAALGPLMAGRADAEPDRSQAGKLRTKALSKVLNFRESLRDAYPTVAAHAHADHVFFGYYDLLEQSRERSSLDAEPPPPPPVTPAPGA